MSEALRKKLTNAGRVLTSQDQGDFVAGHVTVRLPDDPHRFLMKPGTIGLDEMTLDNIITVDLDGQKVGGTMPRHNEVYIHSEVLRGRRADLYTNVFNYLVRSWCRIHGGADDPCCAEHYETDTSGYKG